MALARAWKQMSWFYYQYLLVTALYMLEPWERTVFTGFDPNENANQFISLQISGSLSCLRVTLLDADSLGALVNVGSGFSGHCLSDGRMALLYSMLVSIVGMALYTGYVFMPQHIMAILHYFEIVQ